MKTILRDTHSLDAAGVDNISEQIADVLADYPYITKRDILRLRLGAEEILLHWRQEVGELRVELSIEEKGRWVDLMLQMDGVPYRLTPPDAAEVSGVSGVESTLANLGIDWTYQFDHGQNSAYISVEARESHRVRHVLTAMALAAASAVLLRLLPAAVDVVQNYVTQPLLALCSRFLTAVVTPMMLLAVISGVLSVGSPRTFHRVGRYACIRFLFSMLVVILCAGVLCAVFFPFRFSTEGEGSHAVFGRFLSGIVPADALSPLIDGNMLQLVFVGTVVGMAMLFLQRRVGMTAQLVDEGSAIVLKLLTGFERAAGLRVSQYALHRADRRRGHPAELRADDPAVRSFLHRGDGGAICVCRPQDGVFGRENVGDPAANLYGAVGLGLLLLRLFRRL